MDASTRRAWTGLVNFANGVAAEAGELRRTIANCMHWVTAVEPLGLLDPMLLPDQELLRQVLEYRSSIEVLLRWLCSEPESDERNTLRQQALDFLRVHTGHIKGVRLKEVFYNQADVEKLNYPPAEMERLKEEHDKYWADWKDSPLGILTPSKDYEDIADPICDFLLSEYQKYRSRERNRRDQEPPPAFPIFTCPRCNKLVMPERTGRKKYCSDCSDLARAEKYRQKAPNDENRDYQWLYRLRKMNPDLRRLRLRSPKGQERLKEIKARQRNSSRCQRLILDMRL
jgi:hypothetical protein